MTTIAEIKHFHLFCGLGGGALELIAKCGSASGTKHEEWLLAGIAERALKDASK